MVFKFLTFIPNDNSLKTRPGSPPAFTPSPSVASPIVCSGCTGVISRFDELQLQDRSRDGGAVEEAQDKNPGGRNGSAGTANPIAEKQPTIPIIKAKMEKTPSWLAPPAANTIKSRVNKRPTGKGDFIRISTLYHADKEKTDCYIVELLFWLHQLVCRRRAMNNGVTRSVDLMVSSLSNEEIILSSHSSCRDVNKRKLMRSTSETLESETGNPYSCYYHLPCTGRPIWGQCTIKVNRSGDEC